jgi:hypothetical protein
MMGFPTCSNLFQRKYGRSSSLPGHIFPSQPTFTVLVHISSGTVCSLKFLTNKSWLRLLGDVLGDPKKCPRHSRNRFLKWWMIPQMVVCEYVDLPLGKSKITFSNSEKTDEWTRKRRENDGLEHLVMDQRNHTCFEDLARSSSLGSLA